MAATPLNFDSNEAKAYIAIAVGVMGLAYLWLRPMLKKKRRDPLEKAPFSSLSQQRSVEREMQNLLVELSEMSRQVTAQLDTRAKKLDLLIQEADQKIAQLTRLSREGASDDRAIGSPRANVEGDARSGELVESPAEPFGKLRMSLDSSHSEEGSAKVSTSNSEVEETPPDPRHAEIYALAAEGIAAPEIARQLGRPRGEIELILALRGASARRRAVG
jgi:hypothetical protein